MSVYVHVCAYVCTCEHVCACVSVSVCVHVCACVSVCETSMACVCSGTLDYTRVVFLSFSKALCPDELNMLIYQNNKDMNTNPLNLI